MAPNIADITQMRSCVRERQYFCTVDRKAIQNATDRSPSPPSVRKPRVLDAGEPSVDLDTPVMVIAGSVAGGP